MTAFLNDTFTEASDLALTSHTPELGGAWLAHPTFANGMTVIAADGAVAGASGSTSIYYNATTPPGADYKVDAVLRWTAAGAGGRPGILLRCSPTASTFYQVYFDGSVWSLGKQVAGAGSELAASGTPSTAANTDHTVSLTVTTVGANVTLQLVINGIVFGLVTDTSSPILAAGHVAVRGQTQARIRSLTADDLAVAGNVTDAGGIASGEAFGTAVVSVPSPVRSVTGAGDIASGEAFGTATVLSDAPVPPSTPTLFAADGIWTWFTDPRAVYRNGATYFMAVSSAGIVSIHKYVHATGITQSFALGDVGEVDDHDNGALLFLPDGKIFAVYSQHNDGFWRYRVSTAAEDISAWGSEQLRGAPIGGSYHSPYQLSASGGKTYLFQRVWTDGTGATRALSYRTTATLTGSSDPWSTQNDVMMVAGYIPYWQHISDGVSRIHFLCTDGHPVQRGTSLFHFYMELDGTTGLPRWYRSDGVEIGGSLPFPSSDGGLIHSYSVTGVKCWVSSAAIDSSGYPRVLYMRYPNNDGTAIEYWHGRWTGSAWVSHKITDDGAGLYGGEEYYHGGLVFDAVNPATVYLSAPISSRRQVQRWATADDGATWAKVADVTTGSGAGLRARPYSPRNHNGEVPVLWWDGIYTSYTSYSTAVYGLVGSAAVTATIIDAGGIASGEVFGIATLTETMGGGTGVITDAGGIASGEAFGAALVASDALPAPVVSARASGFYPRLQATAARLLTAYGQPMTLRKRTPGAYDPATGAAAVTEVDSTVQAAEFDVPAAMVNGTSIMRGDRQVVMTGGGSTPDVGDLLVAGGVARNIVSVKATAPAGLVVIYELVTRL